MYTPLARAPDFVSVVLAAIEVDTVTIDVTQNKLSHCVLSFLSLSHVIILLNRFTQPSLCTFVSL